MKHFYVAVIASLILAGCSVEAPDSSDADVEGNIVVSVEAVNANTDLSKGDHVVKVDGDVVTVMLGGSGSCPPSITTGVYNETTNTVAFNMFEYPEDTMCTMDYRQYFYDITVMEGVLNPDINFIFCARGECYSPDV
jgi:hypothetical protein